MRYGFLGTFLITISLLSCLPLPVQGVCLWSFDTSYSEGITGLTDCDNNFNSSSWPHLPTDSEISAAKTEYLDYLQNVAYSGKKIRIENITVIKFHFCSARGGTPDNLVEMEVDYSYWWDDGRGGGKWLRWIQDTGLIYSPGKKKFEFVYGDYHPVYNAFPSVPSDYKLGFNQGSCGDVGVTPTTPPPPPNDDTPWIVVIGTMIVIGGGLLIAIRKVGGRRDESTGDNKQEEKNKREEEQIRYILQLSTDHVTVTPDSPARLNVTAWKIVGSRSPAPAPEAAITLMVAAGNEGLSVSPSSGTGSVQVTITLVSQVAKSPVLVTVTASAGKSSVSSQVVVDIPVEYLMEFF